MRLYILIIFLIQSVLLLSCNNQKELFEQGNIAPQITFNGLGNSLISDSIKLSIKNSQKVYSVNVNLADINKNLNALNYSIKTGAGKISVNGKPAEDGIIKISFEETLQNLKMEYAPDAVGHHVIELTATDKFDKRSTATIEIFGFNNLTPVANFKIYNEQVRDSREYLIDATSSFDADSAYGGGILWYKYKFNEIEKITKEKKLKYIFPATQEDETGIWRVSLSVQDSDGDWSSEVVDFVSVQ